MQDDRNNPTLSELEKAFNIESVTKEFFERYKNLFLKVKEELDSIVERDRKIREDFASKKIETADFAKKLLGQIVFLYFLQKKGWLGVEKDEAGNFKGWGTGPKDFLRRLFDKRIVPYDNFFNDLLEPLFYEALAIDRRVESFYSPFKCKIPFLNGGLFEPICGYNWQETDIFIGNETFALIFDTFDLYNFTVREDEPLEKEVAVDPEMLGKVFENLLEVKDRKSKGAFYTPREIVHYMCQESLINYLDTGVNTRKEDVAPQKQIQRKLFGTPEPEQLAIATVKHHEVIPREDIECFIHHGEFAIEHDKTVEEKGRETRDYKYHLPESIRLNARLIDNALANIKICDIAIGSGAFPVGMLHEIVTARETMTAYIGKSSERTRYVFKRHAIHESIYGVDIDPSAVDIAKLRLWLSLVVDEDDFETIKPLPNLDYKIVCGNSLLGVERNLLNDHLFKELETLKRLFFDETNPRKKREEKEKIDRLIKQITNNDEHFDFEIYFSEVFHQKGGFDIVIGNPPYVRAESGELHLTLRRQIEASRRYETLWERWDLYIPFIERGYKVLNSGGVTTMIVSDAYCHSKYAQKSQNWFLKNSRILRLDFFSKIKLFEAGVHNITYFFQKSDGTHWEPERRVHDPGFGSVKLLPTKEQCKLNNRVFFPEDTAILRFSKPTVTLEEICYISEGMAVHASEEVAQGAFELRDLVQNNKDNKHPKPFVEGKHLDKWLPKTVKWLEWNTERAPIMFRRPTFIEMYEIPEKILVQRSPGPDPKCCYDDQQLLFAQSAVGIIPWLLLRGVRNNSLKKRARYLSEKPARPDLPRREELEKTSQRFAVKFLLAIMNSTPARDFLRSNRRSNIHLYADDWKKLPIPDAMPERQEPIIKLVYQLLSLKQDNPDSPDIPRLETEMDQLVYGLYGLTEEEIKVVDGA